MNRVPLVYRSLFRGGLDGTTASSGLVSYRHVDTHESKVFDSDW